MRRYVRPAGPSPINTPTARLVSRLLDALIIDLDACPSPLRARWLRLRKRALELRVPRIEVQP